jgi:hypothetical protein
MSDFQYFKDYHGYLILDLQKICDYKHDVAEVTSDLIILQSVCRDCKNELEKFNYSISADQIEQLQQNLKNAKTQWTSKVGTAEMTYVREGRGYYELTPGKKNKVIYDVSSKLDTCIDWLIKMKQQLRIIKEKGPPVYIPTPESPVRTYDDEISRTQKNSKIKMLLQSLRNI